MRRKVWGFIVMLVCILGIGTASVYAVTGTEIVNDLINNYVGKYPYVYGTHGPNSFDCSGLVYYIYNQHGITLSHTTDTDWTQYGTVITDTSQLKDGDILLFGESWSNLHHAGIYDSNGGYIIQALNKNRGIIREPTLSAWINSPGWNSYGWNNFQYAVRVINDVDPTPPSNPKISLSSRNIGVGEKLTITYSANNATNYRIGYVLEGGSLQVVEKGAATSASLTFSKAGKYVIHVQCTNAYGSVDTEYISFNVYGSAPTNPTISLSTTFLAAAQTLTLNYSAINATNYRIGYVVDGGALQVIEKGTSTSANLQFDKAGNYVIHVQCVNACGSVDTKYIGFLVYDSAPKNCKITVPKTTIKVGESLPLNITADYADRYGFNIYRDDVRVRHTHTIYENDNKNYPITFSEAGVYKIYGLSLYYIVIA